MHVEWYGQSAFRLRGESATVFIDPFGDTSAFAYASATDRFEARTRLQCP